VRQQDIRGGLCGLSHPLPAKADKEQDEPDDGTRERQAEAARQPLARGLEQQQERQAAKRCHGDAFFFTP